MRRHRRNRRRRRTSCCPRTNLRTILRTRRRRSPRRSRYAVPLRLRRRARQRDQQHDERDDPGTGRDGDQRRQQPADAAGHRAADQRSADASEHPIEQRRRQPEEPQPREQDESDPVVEPPARMRRGAVRLRSAGRRQRFTGDDGEHPVDAGIDAADEVSTAKRRDDVFLDDALRRDVGQRALESLADLDAQLFVVLGNQQQDPVIDALAAEQPLIGDALAVLIDGLGLRRRHHQHRELAALLRFPRCELLLECRLFR